MKKVTGTIVISLFVLLLAVFVFVGVIAPKDEQSGIDENRTLKQMPEITKETVLSGQFSVEFEDYLSDNIGFRSKFMKLSSKINDLKGVSTNLGKIVYVKKDLGAGGETDEKNRLLVQGNRIMEIYSFDEEKGKKYADAVNKYAEAFSDKAEIYSMLIPTQIEFAGKIYSKTSYSQKDAIEKIYGSITDTVKKVDVYNLMKENSKDYIYFRTDHHWTQRGAYIGYKAFVERSGGSAVEISELKPNRADGFFGFLYNQANDTSIAGSPDYIEWFEGEENYTVNATTVENGKLVEYKSKIYVTPDGAPKYSVFMGGDHSFAEINTNVKNGKTVLVIKDSYANALIPLLTNNYETVLAVDPRSYYGKVEEIVEKHGVDQILIMNYVFTPTFDDFIEKISEICK